MEQTSKELKFCKDCRYHSKIHLYDWCCHPSNGYNLIDGNVKKISAEFARSDSKLLTNGCGIEGRFFEIEQIQSKKSWLKQLLKREKE